MILDTNWAFDLTDFSNVWLLVVQIGLLLIALLFGNLLRRIIPFLRKAYIPSALIGGLLLLLLNLLFKAVGVDLPGVDGGGIIHARIMQIITYHALAIGFIAMTLKIANKDNKASFKNSVQNGAITGGTYMLQAVLGILVSLMFFWIGKNMFYDAGVLLPLGFGQGPGNALAWDNNFTELTKEWTEYSFNGQGSVGLTIASTGFIVASLGSIAYINFFKHKGQIKSREASEVVRNVEDFEISGEIEDSESVDKMSIQIALVFLAYALAFAIMIGFAKLSSFTNSIAWGFNFIWGVITANLVKLVYKFLRKKNVVKKKYINNYQMDRISGFAFDMMIIAGVAAIDIDIVAQYIWLIVIVCVLGTVATFIYVRMMSKLCFKGFEHEAFLTNYGTLTGTASNGMIFLREVDPNYETPMSNIFIVSQLPAMIFVAPLLLLLNLSAKSTTGCYIALGIFAGLFCLYTGLIIFLAKHKKKAKEEA